ncbi:unnamed protein product [Trichobilharzia regenti]|nr:unnamed protein product [Trichobilharzia regenti]
MPGSAGQLFRPSLGLFTARTHRSSNPGPSGYKLPSDGVPMDFKNIHEAIDLAIDKELYVSTQIVELHKLASKMNDATVSSFQYLLFCFAFPFIKTIFR